MDYRDVLCNFPSLARCSRRAAVCLCPVSSPEILSMDLNDNIMQQNLS